MLVVLAIGLATIMSVAVLASTSLHLQVEANILAAAQANSLAESGVNVGIYYLQHPADAPLLNSSGFYPGQNAVGFGADVPGTANISVTNVGTNTYDVTAVASTTASSQLTRSLSARVYVKAEYQQTVAASFAGNFTLPTFMTITGDVRCDGVLSLAVGSSVSAVIQAAGSNAPIWDSLPAYPLKAAPGLTDLNIYNTLGNATPTYQYVSAAGIVETGTAQLLSAVETGSPTPAPTNPKNVWYANSSVTLTNFVLNGTLVLRGPSAKLIIVDTAKITARANMPALVVESAIQFLSDAIPKSLTVDGVAWIGEQVATTSGLDAWNCELKINGALLTGPNVHGVSNKYHGTVSVDYVPANVNVPNLSAVGSTPSSVKILRWGN